VGVTAVVRDITERTAYEAQLHHHVLHDTVTGLPNRTLFHDRLQQTVALSRRTGTPCAVLVLDLDEFQLVNNAYGHAIGDELLREIGTRFAQSLRDSDSLARLESDEYAVLLPETDLVGAVHAATKLTYLLEQPIVLGEHRVHVGVTIGISLYPDHGETAELLLRHADVAMSAAQEANSGYALYAADQDPSSPMHLTLSNELRHAIQSDQLVLYYQPKVRLSMSNVDGMEALVRWNHPEHGIIPPIQFIPFAEHSGLIRPLTLWVIENALAQWRRWKDTGFDLTISVNLSARSLHDLELPTRIEQLLEQHRVPASKLTVELTETVIMANPERAMEMLTRLTTIGINVSIDDFGTGYSSLAYLQHLQVNELKIDKSFIMDLDTNRDNGFIVRSVIDLGHNLGLEVTAEGVESQASLDTLAVLTCDWAQGYHLSRPLGAEEITRWLRARQTTQHSESHAPSAHIAVVEDEQSILYVLQSFLSIEGYSVTSFRDPRLLDSLSPPSLPDLFLIDLMLPGLSGIELAQKLQEGQFAGVPIIGISASNLMLKTAAETDLFHALIAKPFEITDVLSAIARAVPKRAH
jgi:diguanylate cyclase (GGDEF)-like protein